MIPSMIEEAEELLPSMAAVGSARQKIERVAGVSLQQGIGLYEAHE